MVDGRWETSRLHTTADGTHPTGIHSCLVKTFRKLNKNKDN